MSTMTLFHSPASPFVRKVMVLLHETGQTERVALHEVQLSPVAPNAAVLEGNPAGKIPALRLADGGGGVTGAGSGFSGAARITPSTDSMVRKVAEHSILVHW